MAHLFLAVDDFHDHTAVLTKTAGKQMSEDKPVTQEHKQSAFEDKIGLNDETIPSGNLMLSSCQVPIH